MRLLRYLDLAVLVGCSVWIGSDPKNVEPYVAALVAFGVYVGVEAKDSAKAPLIEASLSDFDKDLFRKLTEVVPGRAIERIEGQDFEALYHESLTEPLYAFESTCRDVDHEFMDVELESKRKALAVAIDEFLRNHAENTFSEREGLADLRRIPPEWLVRYPDRHRDAVVSLNDSSAKLATAYKDLVRRAREKLGLPHKVTSSPKSKNEGSQVA